MGKLWVVDFMEQDNNTMQKGLYGGTLEEVCCMFDEAKEVLCYSVREYRANEVER